MRNIQSAVQSGESKQSPGGLCVLPGHSQLTESGLFVLFQSKVEVKSKVTKFMEES